MKEEPGVREFTLDKEQHNQIDISLFRIKKCENPKHSLSHHNQIVINNNMKNTVAPHTTSQAFVNLLRNNIGLMEPYSRTSELRETLFKIVRTRLINQTLLFGVCPSPLAQFNESVCFYNSFNSAKDQNEIQNKFNNIKDFEDNLVSKFYQKTQTPEHPFQQVISSFQEQDVQETGFSLNPFDIKQFSQPPEEDSHSISPTPQETTLDNVIEEKQKRQKQDCTMFAPLITTKPHVERVNTLYVRTGGSLPQKEDMSPSMIKTHLRVNVSQSLTPNKDLTQVKEIELSEEVSNPLNQIGDQNEFIIKTISNSQMGGACTSQIGSIMRKFRDQEEFQTYRFEKSIQNMTSMLQRLTTGGMVGLQRKTKKSYINKHLKNWRDKDSSLHWLRCGPDFERRDQMIFSKVFPEHQWFFNQNLNKFDCLRAFEVDGRQSKLAEKMEKMNQLHSKIYKYEKKEIDKYGNKVSQQKYKPPIPNADKHFSHIDNMSLDVSSIKPQSDHLHLIDNNIRVGQQSNSQIFDKILGWRRKSGFQVDFHLIDDTFGEFSVWNQVVQGNNQEFQNYLITEHSAIQFLRYRIQCLRPTVVGNEEESIKQQAKQVYNLLKQKQITQLEANVKIKSIEKLITLHRQKEAMLLELTDKLCCEFQNNLRGIDRQIQLLLQQGQSKEREQEQGIIIVQPDTQINSNNDTKVLETFREPMSFKSNNRRAVFNQAPIKIENFTSSNFRQLSNRSQTISGHHDHGSYQSQHHSPTTKYLFEQGDSNNELSKSATKGTGLSYAGCQYQSVHELKRFDYQLYNRSKENHKKLVMGSSQLPDCPLGAILNSNDQNQGLSVDQLGIIVKGSRNITAKERESKKDKTHNEQNTTFDKEVSPMKSLILNLPTLHLMDSWDFKAGSFNLETRQIEQLAQKKTESISEAMIPSMRNIQIDLEHRMKQQLDMNRMIENNQIQCTNTIDLKQVKDQSNVVQQLEWLVSEDNDQLQRIGKEIVKIRNHKIMSLLTDLTIQAFKDAQQLTQMRVDMDRKCHHSLTQCYSNHQDRNPPKMIEIDQKDIEINNLDRIQQIVTEIDVNRRCLDNILRIRRKSDDKEETGIQRHILAQIRGIPSNFNQTQLTYLTKCTLMPWMVRRLSINQTGSHQSSVFMSEYSYQKERLNSAHQSPKKIKQEVMRENIKKGRQRELRTLNKGVIGTLNHHNPSIPSNRNGSELDQRKGNQMPEKMNLNLGGRIQLQQRFSTKNRKIREGTIKNKIRLDRLEGLEGLEMLKTKAVASNNKTRSSELSPIGESRELVMENGYAGERTKRIQSSRRKISLDKMKSNVSETRENLFTEGGIHPEMGKYMGTVDKEIKTIDIAFTISKH